MCMCNSALGIWRKIDCNWGWDMRFSGKSGGDSEGASVAQGRRGLAGGAGFRTGMSVSAEERWLAAGKISGPAESPRSLINSTVQTATILIVNVCKIRQGKSSRIRILSFIINHLAPPDMVSQHCFDIRFY